ncbi:hypothetical protein AAMO2058_001129500 [Amorphochlora amoebiformis]|uniref:Uncharacterized protein n=1 Tax=Amorphochlora amoebiformis TaxID=1561963 RepID=A0A7S0GUX7_9EUKA|mmetsp:Transcript_16320/g.25856  ORF Transcript_16320/g.25856 Transcript_16320/m.25856 type:complete len:252 (+) Transcript_16320:22-777(+)
MRSIFLFLTSTLAHPPPIRPLKFKGYGFKRVYVSGKKFLRGFAGGQGRIGQGGDEFRGIPYESIEIPEDHMGSLIRDAEKDTLPEGHVVLASTEGLEGKFGEGKTNLLVQETQEDAYSLLEASKIDSVELSLTLCDDDTIRGYNKEHRGIDKPTDVLSFPLQDDYMIGDLIISIDKAQSQADEREYGLRDEIRILMVHGLLHLLGYDHDKSEGDWKEMAEAERKLIDRLGWSGSGLVDLADIDAPHHDKYQ